MESIKKGLEVRWNLKFPERDKNWSPSKVVEPKLGDQVLSRLKYLNYQDKDGLQKAVQDFEKKAIEKTMRSQWVQKPLADPDVLLRRQPSRRLQNTSTALSHSSITAAMAAELMESLLQILTLAVDQAKLKNKATRNSHSVARLSWFDSFRSCVSKSNSFTGSDSLEGQRPLVTSPPKTRPRNSKQSQLDCYFTHKKESEPDLRTKLFYPANNRPSSDEYDPGAGISKLMEDESMEDVIMHDDTDEERNNEGNAWNNDLTEDDDRFLEAPYTPSKIKRSRTGLWSGHDDNTAESEILCRKQPDLIPLAYQSQASKKRTSGNSMRPPVSKKATLGILEPQTPIIYHVNHLSPIEAPKLEPPRLEAGKARSSVSANFPLPIPEQTRTFLNEPRASISFETNTSFTSSVATSTNQIWTPNTSFPANSVGTSFDSSADTTDVSHSFLEQWPYQNQSISDTALQLAPEAAKLEPDIGYPILNVNTKNHAVQKGSGNISANDKKIPSRNVTEYPPDQIFPPELLSERATKDFYIFSFANSVPAPIARQTKYTIPLRQLYEVTRVSIHSKLPMTDFSTCLDQIIDDYRELWSSLGSLVKRHAKSLPERSSDSAWNRATRNYDCVSLTGDLKFAEQAGGTIFDFSLKPMKVEKSYRLARNFGGDRFCVLGMPGITNEYLPGYLRGNHIAVYESITNRLGDTCLNLLGRVWRAFYSKPEPSKKTRRGNQTSLNETKHRLYFFACDGHDFKRDRPRGEIDPRKAQRFPISVDKFLDWFMPFERNRDQPCLKLFARLSLGLCLSPF